jgi:GNAT superfamily N-acetyltransferase
VDREYVDRLDLVRCDVELTLDPADTLEMVPTVAPVVARHTAGWDDVVAEISRSCARRAPEGAMWQRVGAVGVLSGPASVVWVHGTVDEDELLGTLAAAPEVHEAYVTCARGGVVAQLETAGWTPVEVMLQMTCDATAAAAVAADLPPFLPLGPADLPDLRELLRVHAGADDAFLASSYPDDFFEVAAPVWVFGARDDSGRLVASVAVRRQGRGALGFALIVAQEWRSRGLAKAAVAAALAQAFASGADFVQAQAGEASQALLVECGFTVVGSWQRMTR